jgi:hypothetical protein
MIGPSHHRGAPERLDRVEHAPVVGRHEHGVDCRRGGGATIHVFDHRAAADVGQRLAREACRVVSRGDDSYVARASQRAEGAAGSVRVHGES